MKEKLVLLFALVVAAVGGLAAGNENVESRPTADQPLYLHLLALRYYTTPPIPAKRIVSARVYVGQSFAVSVNGDANTTLSGRIDREGGKFVGKKLSGTSHGTKNIFDGELKLETPTRARAGLSGSAIFGAVIVLSTNADCGAFIKMIDPAGSG